MPDIKTLQEYVTLLKDIMTTGAALAAILAAIAWRIQFVWKIKYELAQRLMRAAYQAKQALAEVRTYYTTEDERLLALEESKVKVSGKRTFLNYERTLFNKRWQKSHKAFT